MPHYEKGAKGVYAFTARRLGIATQRAGRLRRMYRPDTGGVPYTNVDELVARLRALKPAVGDGP